MASGQPDSLSDEEMSTLRTEHRLYSEGRISMCFACGEDWPCVTSRLLTTIDRLDFLQKLHKSVADQWMDRNDWMDRAVEAEARLDLCLQQQAAAATLGRGEQG